MFVTLALARVRKLGTRGGGGLLHEGATFTTFNCSPAGDSISEGGGLLRGADIFHDTGSTDDDVARQQPAKQYWPIRRASNKVQAGIRPLFSPVRQGP